MTLRGTEITTKVKIVVETCCFCGTPFGVEQVLEQRLRRNHDTFWCPMGHRQNYTSETEEECLRRQLATAQEKANSQAERTAAEVTRANIAEYALKEDRKELKRLQRRVDNGVCIHCHRSFKQLARHMKSKHVPQ